MYRRAIEYIKNSTTKKELPVKDTSRLQINIPLDLHPWLLKWAKKNGRSMSKQIIANLESIRDEQEKQAAQSAQSK